MAKLAKSQFPLTITTDADWKPVRDIWQMLVERLVGTGSSIVEARRWRSSRGLTQLDCSPLPLRGRIARAETVSTGCAREARASPRATTLRPVGAKRRTFGLGVSLAAGTALCETPLPVRGRIARGGDGYHR